MCANYLSILVQYFFFFHFPQASYKRMKTILPLLASVPLAVAWFPGVDKDLFAATGDNIFNSTTNAIN